MRKIMTPKTILNGSAGGRMPRMIKIAPASSKTNVSGFVTGDLF